ncbi:hypothetical protein [Krasilnikovia sp. MM14-A1259]|uniref:hypothetical protein n=1 Tax=Krasilnikovia sp. MM14-A1259 TaxID=3373539 RepID=UPI003828A1FC
MSDIKQMCDRLVEGAPPLRGGDAVLANARRSARRSRRTAVAAAGLLTATALAAGGMYAGTGAKPAVEQGGTGLAPAPATNAALAPAGLPPARAAADHGEAMQRLLVTAVPAGTNAKPVEIKYDASLDPHSVLPDAAHPAPAKGIMGIAGSTLLVQDGGREGALSAEILIGGTRVPGCKADARTTCTVREVRGVRIEIATWTDKAGAHIVASRLLQGGALVVMADQGHSSDEHTAPLDAPGKARGSKPSLTTMPFTVEEIAELAAKPDMLQFH